MAFGIPILVAALAAQSPVHVATCAISAPPQGLGREYVGTAVFTGDDELHVRFTNRGNQPVTRVVFALSDGSTVVDAGTFAPGVTIDHTFYLTPTDADSCSVASATFSDGTEWNAH
jgi:hypothetical protein